jgi:hypothetical protein
MLAHGKIWSNDAEKLKKLRARVRITHRRAAKEHRGVQLVLGISM